jgi:hypothetical protein
MTATLQRSLAVLALLAALAAGCSSSHASKSPMHHHATKSATGSIPQHNGGDHDTDNNGGPSDGDGNL